MAHVQITDVVVPREFAEYFQLLTTTKSAFVQSGVVDTNPYFSNILAGGGKTFDLPFWKDLADTEANVSGDAKADYQSPANSPETDAVPLEITTGQEVCIRHNRNQSWSAADLASALAGSDPMTAIANRVSDYWVRQDQTYLIKSLVGVFADNAANDSGDMIKDISTSGSVTDANRFSAEALIDAIQTMGDNGDVLAAIAVHSVVFRRMQKLDLIDFVKDSTNTLDIPFYQGKRVIVDDSMPTSSNGGNTTYWSYLFGRGVVAMGSGSARVPVEVQRSALAGNGGGQETLTTRRTFILHPRGFSWLSGSMAGQSPTNAELALAANWNRVYAERKQIPLAALRVNA